MRLEWFRPGFYNVFDKTKRAVYVRLPRWRTHVTFSEVWLGPPCKMVHPNNIFFTRAWVLRPRWRTPSTLFSRAGVLRPKWRTPSEIFSRAWALHLKRRTSSTFSEASLAPVFQMANLSYMPYTYFFARSLYIIEPIIRKINQRDNGSKQYQSSSPL